MNKRKHVGFIIQRMTGGGAERVTSVLVNKYIEKGYQVTLITFEKNEKEYFIDKSVKRIIINNKNANKFTKYIISSIELVKIMKEIKCDIYIAIDIFANLIGCISKVFVKSKLIISERNCPKYNKISFLTKVLRKLLFRNADYYVFQTEGAKKFYSKDIQRRSVVIGNPLKESLPIKNMNSKKEIVAIGRLVEQKNYPLLIEAFNEFIQKFAQYKLIIYGEGNKRNEIEDHIKRLGIQEKVELRGYCENIHNHILDSEIFVMTSNYEGMPNSLMEAMAMGFPVISTDCPSGGPKELIINNKNGILVEVNNKEQLVNSMILLASDSDIKNTLSKEAMKIRDDYNINKIIKLWDSLIIKLTY